MRKNFLAILFAISITLLPAYLQATPTAATLVQQKKCNGCHRFSPDTDEILKKAPDLFYSGNKFQKTWLRQYLQNPTPIRKTGYITDPGFLLGKPTMAKPHDVLSSQEADIITNYLLSLKLSEIPITALDNEPLSKEKKARAKIYFERDFGCTTCHEAINLAKKARGGVSGPSLVDAGNRLQPKWIFQWLSDPRKFEPKGRMPLFDFSQRKEELLLIIKYILTLKKEMLR